MVATKQHRSDPGYSDIQMTRSMCDWRASDLVLPNPQIRTFSVPAGARHRICLASDGLWDICSFDAAAKVMATASTCKAAANKLLGMACKEYLEVREHDTMDDDTTILVVELNPSGIAPPRAGCCSVA